MARAGNSRVLINIQEYVLWLYAACAIPFTFARDFCTRFPRLVVASNTTGLKPSYYLGRSSILLVGPALRGLSEKSRILGLFTWCMPCNDAIAVVDIAMAPSLTKGSTIQSAATHKCASIGAVLLVQDVLGGHLSGSESARRPKGSTRYQLSNFPL